MPAFSYKERFIPFVQDGSKTQTIRAFRKHPVRPGQVLSHFYGMRTKHCTRIIENTYCLEVKTIFIMKDGSIWLADHRMLKGTAEFIMVQLHRGTMLEETRYAYSMQKLDEAQADLLAWQDGFRAHANYYETYLRQPGFENHQLMMKWWNQTHDLPFAGQLIKWNPAAVKPISKKIQPCRSTK